MNQRERPDPNYSLSQRFVLGGLFHLEDFLRAMENPNLPISRRTAIFGGLSLVGVLILWKLLEGEAKKEEPESILTPAIIANNERRRLAFYNTTETPIILFSQNLERFLDQKRIILPAKIGFLFQNHPQPQAIKDTTNLTFYFNLREKPTADLDLELSAHILALLFLASQSENLKNSPSWQPENGFKLLSELSQTPIGEFYRSVLKELRENVLPPILEIK